jgi:hypothetical protein
MRTPSPYTLFFLLLLAGGCSDFLFVEPEDDLSRDEVFSTLRGAEAAVIGLYADRTGTTDYYQQAMPIYADLQGNMMLSQQGTQESREDIDGQRADYIFAHALDITADYDFGKYDDTYSLIYTMLYQANDVLAGLANVTDAGDGAQVQSLRGEALVFRAIGHHDLVRLFAQAPGYTANASHPGIALVTEVPTPETLLDRSSVAEVYASIRADLEEALTLVDTRFSRRSSQPYWISPAIINGLLARVTAYTKDWESCRAYATACIDGSPVELTPRENYLDEFISSTPSETLWALDLQRKLSPDGEPVIPSPGRVVGSRNPDPYLQVSGDLLALFEVGDIRTDLIATNDAGDRLSRKWPLDTNFVRNIPLLRLSEVYLLRAEAVAELGDLSAARDDLSRIYLRAVPDGELPPLDQASLLQAIRRERRRELAFEGHHFFDLGRWGADLERAPCADFIQRCDLSYPSDYYILPIPRDALFRNPRLTQNPGY